MKRRHIYAAAVMLAMAISFNGYSEDYFYTAGGVKVELQQVPGVYLLGSDVDVDSIKTDLIKTKEKIYNMEMGTRLGFFTIVTSEASQDELERLDGVRNVNPGYTCDLYLLGYVDTIFPTGDVQVMYTNTDNISVLEGMANEYNYDLSSLSTVSENTRTLLCRKDSKISAIELANMIYELNIFEHVWPDIQVKSDALCDLCGGGGVTLGVSNKGRKSPNTANITVRQTGRVLKISVNNRATARYGVELYSVSGKRQRVSPVYHTDGMITVALPHVATGSYILRVGDGKSGMERRVLVR
jgi:hypothetical protein